MSEENANPEKPKRQVVLTLIAQQYGLTVDDLIEQGFKMEEIVVEKPE